MQYDFDLLVSYRWNTFTAARGEALSLLSRMGDDKAVVKRTVAQGVAGVKTFINARDVIKGLRRLFQADPFAFQYTLKWLPVDRWTSSHPTSISGVVQELGIKIGEGERWRMTVEKRRYTQHHRIEIINQLAGLIHRKVDLKNPDWILYINIIGGQAGISLLKPDEIFSLSKASLQLYATASEMA